jgi:hypothetical protein
VPTLSKATLDLLALIGVGVGVVALLLGIGAFVRLHQLRREYDVLQGEGDRESFLTAVGRQRQELIGLRREIEAAKSELAVARAELHDAIRHVAVVRYDAFADMGGRLSFSAAMLDDAGDGLVITAINGRSETRTYAKGVKGGVSEQALSPEEQQAIGYATGTTPPRLTRRARKAAEAAEPKPDPLNDPLGHVTGETSGDVDGDVEGFTVRP